jgi:methyl-accepting chemotaxis protein
MNTHTKTAVTIILSLIVAVSLILAFAIYSITAKGNEEIKKFRAEEIQRIKQYIKDSVDMAYTTIESNHKNSMDKVYLEKYYGPRLKNIIDVAETVLNSKVQAVKNGKLTLSEAQAQAAAEIKTIRYNNGNGYVWITDTTLPYPKMIMHPIEPSLDGQVLDDPKYNCALGKDKNLFTAAVEICQAHGKGFVDYLWPKKTQEGVIPDVPKLAYVRLFPKWDWLIGTADYVDDAIIEAIEKSKDEIRQMRYDNGIGYFWISSASKTDLKLIVHPMNPSLEEQILEGKIKNMFNSFVELCEKQNGSGFLDYTSPKQMVGGMIQDAQKISYVRLYEPLGWIVGTDVSIEKLDKAVAEKQKVVEHQEIILILKLVSLSILVILLFWIVIYKRSRYFSKVKPQAVAEPVEKEEAPVEKPAKVMSEEIPVLTPTPEHKMLSTDDCVKMVQEISKTLIAEHTKLLAMALQKTPQSEPLEVSKTLEEMKKRVEGNQQQSGETAENTKFKVVNDLHKMVGN